MFRLPQTITHVLTQEDIERRENRDKGLVTTLFPPLLTGEVAAAAHASFEQFAENVDARFARELGNRKVFHVSGKRKQ